MSDIVDLGDSEFYYLCRLCALKCSAPGLQIFSDEGLLRDVKKKIQDCLHFIVDDRDKLPKTICRDCSYKLDVSHLFLLKSCESQQFLSDLVNHEVFDTIYVIKNELQHPELCLRLNELPDNATIQDLEHLVDEAHIHADSSDITQIIQYHDGEINDEEIQDIHNLDNIADLQKEDSDPLPDIGLYSFDTISEAVKDEDFLTDAPFQNEDPILIIESHMENIPATTQCASNQVETVAVLPAASVTVPSSSKKASKATLKVCKICGKTFATNYKLNEHQRTHSNKSPLKCSHDGCTKSFRSKIGLTQHEAKHTGEYKFACEICGKGFQIKSYLTIHLKVHSDVKPYKCSICGIHIKAKQALIDHENRHLGVKAYQCCQCDQRFISKALCLTHEKIHQGNVVPNKYPCTVCNKLFVRQSYLKTHMTIHNGNKPYICDVCGNKFLTNLDLKLHSRTHTGEKGYICEVCGKAFIRSDSLLIHKRCHSGERPYKCKFCGQRFAQITSMKIHVRLHTGEKPYSCTLCPRRFVSRGYLQVHLKKHTPKITEDEMFISNFNAALVA